jgi:hypothetical protein
VDHRIRLVVALVVAPLTIPLGTYFYLLSTNVERNWVGNGAFISTIIAYVGVFVVGLPAYNFLRIRRWTFIWIAPLLGFVVGALMWLVFIVCLVLLFDEGLVGVQSALTDKNSFAVALWPSGALGAVAGIIFWLIARPDRDPTVVK